MPLFAGLKADPAGAVNAVLDRDSMRLSQEAAAVVGDFDTIRAAAFVVERAEGPNHAVCNAGRQATW